MKKFTGLFIFACCCFSMSCNEKSENHLSPAAQKNLDGEHAIFKALDSKDFSHLGDYIATNVVDHAGENGEIKGLDSLKAAFMKEVASTEHEKSETIKELADDDYVMSWMHYTGNYTADDVGHKAGDKYDMKSMEITKFKDGKAVEHWTMLDPAEMMKMQATMAKPTMTADSTKKKM